MLTDTLSALEKNACSYLIRIDEVTPEEFDRLTDEDTKAELIDGVMIVHSPATWPHDKAEEFLSGLMGLYAEEKNLGETGGPNTPVHLATCRKVAPDAFFVCRERAPVPLPEEFDGTPDLVVEVLSRGTRSYDLVDKRALYRQAGAPEIWFVDRKNKRLIIDRRRGKRYVEEVVAKGRLYSDVLPGFWIEVSWLWQKRLPKKLDCLRKILGQ